MDAAAAASSISLQQLGLQLGVAGMLMLVGFRIAMVFIKRWGELEDRKTTVLEAGLTKIADGVNAVKTDVAVLASRVETVIDSVIERTPVNSPVGYGGGGSYSSGKNKGGNK